jgi:putative RNA 2'-phosphotransferase
MLKEWRSHGYFRGETCPACGSQGRFLLNDREIELLGRTMAGVLRHFPERYGLEMDAHGWVDLRDFLTAVQIRHRKFRFLRPHHVLALIETDPKGRYQFQDGRIRATYGHSFDVDLDLPTEGIPASLYFPTTEEEVGLLLEMGLKPSDRKWVHLSDSVEKAYEAGKVRSDTPVILRVNSGKAMEAGVVIMRAGKTVYITKEIPPDYLTRAQVELPQVEEEIVREPAGSS